MNVSFRLDRKVMRDFPDTQIRFIAARGLQNDHPWEEVTAGFMELEEKVAHHDWQPFEEADPPIASWHDAYRRFGTNPRRFRPSIDSLSRRLRRDGRLPRINPAVDAYNLVSVSFGVPAGAFDIERLVGTISIRFAGPNDLFTPLGEPQSLEEPNLGEVVYAQGQQILTRHWNYRDSDHTKVTTESRDVVFILERISAEAIPWRQMVDAQTALADLVRPHADEIILAVIEAETPTTDLVDGEPGLII